jgi:hypothetical protein
MSEAIVESLELVAERRGDITADVMQIYHQRCTASAALMEHMDEYMVGRMMDQVLLLLMEDGRQELENYLKFETANHESYGVELHMYDSLLSSVRDCVADVLGDDFDPGMQAAWQARIKTLLEAIEAASTAAA